MALTDAVQESPPGLGPVRRIAAGLVIVYCALRFDGLDLLLNPVGWALCAAALLRLTGAAGDPFDRARAFALVMVGVSTIALFAGGAQQGPESTVVQLIGIADSVGGLIVVWLISDAVIRRLRSYGQESRAAVLDVLRWVVTGLGVLGTLAAFGYAALGPVVTVAWFASLAALVAGLYRSASLPYAGETGAVSDPASTG